VVVRSAAAGCVCNLGADAMAVNQFRRLNSYSVEFSLCAGPDGEQTHRLTACLAYDNRGTLRELNIVSRGKIGQGLDIALHDLGIKLSRAIQGRDPDSGEA
jgi:hypothetical protein